jgi:hypothetical protein
MECFNKEPDKNVIHQDTDHHQQKIAKKLDPAVKAGPGKYHVTHQEESGWETHQERHDESCDIRFEGNEPQVQHLFVKDKVITDKKNENIEQGIRTTAGGVPESL